MKPRSGNSSNNSALRILGIDPGTRIAGYGIIDYDIPRNRTIAVAAGVIRIPRAMELSEKLHFLFTELQDIMTRHRPGVVAVENIFFGKNVQSAIRIGEARAVTLLCSRMNALPIASYPPATIKQAVTGHGRADKAQIRKMVKTLLRLPASKLGTDAFDALAVALCHAYKLRSRHALPAPTKRR